MDLPVNPPGSKGEQSQILTDFKALHDALRKMMDVHNASDGDLHFEALDKADSEIYNEIVTLAYDGLKAVRQHADHFATKALYDDGMFWYDLFLAVSAAARRVKEDKSQGAIPANVIEVLGEILVDVSEFSTVHAGDITKRSAEALHSTVCTFYSKALVRHLRARAAGLKSKSAESFVETVIKGAEEVALRKSE
jgi:hypothetical protein